MNIRPFQHKQAAASQKACTGIAISLVTVGKEVEFGHCEAYIVNLQVGTHSDWFNVWKQILLTESERLSLPFLYLADTMIIKQNYQSLFSFMRNAVGG